jgi:CheY-like chemotaxis protein
MRTSSTVLLVNSDPIERTMVAAYLRGCNYHVIEVADGEEARLALEHREVDVLVSEVELRYHASGHMLASWARSRFPGIEVILTSTLERTAETAHDLCEQQPSAQPRYHPKQLVEEIERLRRRVDAH